MIVTLRADGHSRSRKHIPCYLALQVGRFFASRVNAVVLGYLLDSVLQFVLNAVVHLLRRRGLAHKHQRKVLVEVGERVAVVGFGKHIDGFGNVGRTAIDRAQNVRHFGQFLVCADVVIRHYVPVPCADIEALFNHNICSQ